MKSCTQNPVPVGSNLASFYIKRPNFISRIALSLVPLLLGTKFDDASYLHFTVLVEVWNAMRTLKRL